MILYILAKWYYNTKFEHIGRWKSIRMHMCLRPFSVPRSGLGRANKTVSAIYIKLVLNAGSVELDFINRSFSLLTQGLCTRAKHVTRRPTYLQGVSFRKPNIKDSKTKTITNLVEE